MKFCACLLFFLSFIFNSNSFSQNNEYALSFDGQGYVTSGTIGVAHESRTLSFWLKPNEVSGFSLVWGIYVEGSNYLFQYIAIKDGKLGYGNGNDGILHTINEKIVINEWLHFCMTTNEANTEIYFYLNGKHVSSYSRMDYILYPFLKMYLGGTPTLRSFRGKMTDFAYYTKPMNAIGVKEKMMHCNTISDPKLLMHWKLQEGTGNTIYSATPIAKNGILVNATWAKSGAYTGFESLYCTNVLNSPYSVSIMKIELTVSNPNQEDYIIVALNGGQNERVTPNKEYFPAYCSARTKQTYRIKQDGYINGKAKLDLTGISFLQDIYLTEILYRVDENDTTWEIIPKSAINFGLSQVEFPLDKQKGEYSIGFFDKPNSYRLIYPYNNHTLTDPTKVNLQWSSEEIKNYSVFLSSTFPPNTQLKKNLVNNFLSVENLMPNTKYYWKVQFSRENMSDTLSEIFSFTTCSNNLYDDKTGFNLSGLLIHYNDSTGAYLIEKQTVVPDYPYANTGVSYNHENHNIIISQYGNNSENAPNSIIIRDRRGRLLKTIPLNMIAKNIQGNCYNHLDSTIWFWAVPVNFSGIPQNEDPANPGYCFYEFFHINMNGELLERKKTRMVDNDPGAICIDLSGKKIFVKKNNSMLTNVYDLNTWNLVTSQNSYVGGEGIAISPYEESIWLHDGAYLYYNSKDFTLKNKFISPVERSEAEGLFIDPGDYTVWVAADENFHGGIPGGNRLYHCDPFGTYNKDIRFPAMINWREGVTDSSIVLKDNVVFLKNGYKKGTWTSPILDFKHYSPLKVIASNLSNLSTHYEILYRGSNTPPTTSFNDQFALNYYSATQSNEGWGSTNPNAWQPIIPACRFIQLKIVLSKQNNSPITVDDHYSVLEDSELILSKENGIFANDFDLDVYPDSLILNSITQPKNGTIEIDSLGAFRYHPKLNFFGNDTVFYTIMDGRDSSNISYCVFQVQPQNDPPIITGSNEIVVMEDTPKLIDIQDFFISDVDNIIYSQHEINVLPGTNYQVFGKSILTSKDFFGTINMKVFVNDIEAENNKSNEFIVQCEVLPINDPPVIEAQNPINFDEDTEFQMNYMSLFVNDIDNEYPEGFSFHLIPGDNYTIENLNIIPDSNYFGNIVIPVYVQDGSIENFSSDTFQINAIVEAVNDPPIILGQSMQLECLEDMRMVIPKNALQFVDIDNLPSEITLKLLPGLNYTFRDDTLIPNKNFHGQLSVNVFLNDGHNHSGSFSISVDIIDENDPPVISFPSDLYYSEDNVSDTIAINNYIQDIDDTIITCQFLEGLQIKPIYENNTLIFESKTLNWFGSESIKMLISDGTDTIIDSIRVHCTPVNDSPLVLGQDSALCNEDSSFVIEQSVLHLVDIDNEINDLQIQVLPGSNYTHSQNRVIPDKDYWGRCKVYLRVNDLEAVNNYSEIFEFILDINYRNDCPYLRSDEILILEDSTIAFPIKELVADLDTEDSLFSVFLTHNDTISALLNQDSVYFSSEIENFYGNITKNINISDGKCLQILPIHFKIQNVNDPPHQLQSYFERSEDSLLTIPISMLADDIDSSNLTIKYIFPSSHLNLTTNANGILVRSKMENYLGEDSISFIISDAEVDQKLTIRVNTLAVNDAPNIHHGKIIQYMEDSSVIVNIFDFCNDIDNPNADLTFTIESNDEVQSTWIENGLFKFSSQLINWNGTTDLIIKVSDNDLESSDTLHIICISVNDPPRLQLPDTFYIKEDSVYTLDFSPYIFDADSNQSDYVLSSSNNLQFDISVDGLAVKFDQNVKDWNGLSYNTFLIVDNDYTYSDSAVIKVEPVNDPPHIKLHEYYAFKATDTLSLSLHSIIRDVDNSYTSLNKNFHCDPTLAIIEKNDTLKVFSNMQETINKAYLIFEISDLEYTFYDSVIISIVNDNQLPFIDLPDTIMFFEDETYKITYLDTNYLNKGIYDTIQINWKGNNQINIDQSKYDFIFSTNQSDWYGDEIISAEFVNTMNEMFTKSLLVRIIPINDLPIISGLYPKQEKLKVNMDSNIVFRVKVEDIDSKPLSLWYVNGELAKSGQDTFNYQFNKKAHYNIELNVIDSISVLQRKWEIISEKSDTIIHSNLGMTVYPNPFSNLVNINYYVSDSSKVRLEVYTLLGTFIKTIQDEFLSKGKYTSIWDGSTFSGNKAPPGIYLIRLKSNENIITKIVVYSFHE